MATTIIDRDKGYAKFIRAVLGSEKVSVRVGILSGGDVQHVGSALTVGEVAEIHELGLGVPARPWLRPVVDGQRAIIRARIKRAAQLVAKGGSSVDAMGLVGQSIVNDIRTRIRAGIPPELAESTKASKGGDKDTPLINTGQFIGAITHEVEIKGGKRAQAAIKLVGGLLKKKDKAVKSASKKAKAAKRSFTKLSKAVKKAAKKTTKKAVRSVKKTVKRATRKTRTRRK